MLCIINCEKVKWASCKCHLPSLPVPPSPSLKWFWTRIAISHYNRRVKHGAGFPKRAKARSQPPFFGEGKAGVKKLKINLENPLCSSEIALEVINLLLARIFLREEYAGDRGRSV